MTGMKEIVNRELIAGALEKRLGEAKAYAGADNVEQASGGIEPASPCEDADEALRVFMVRLWPKMKRRAIDREQREDFFRTISQTAGAAAGGDLRYIDAWNNAYEAVAGFDWPPDEKRSLVIPFMKKYIAILERQLEKMGPADA